MADKSAFDPSSMSEAMALISRSSDKTGRSVAELVKEMKKWQELGLLSDRKRQPRFCLPSLRGCFQQKQRGGYIGNGCGFKAVLTRRRKAAFPRWKL